MRTRDATPAELEQLRGVTIEGADGSRLQVVDGVDPSRPPAENAARVAEFMAEAREAADPAPDRERLELPDPRHPGRLFAIEYPIDATEGELLAVLVGAIAGPLRSRLEEIDRKSVV